MLVDLGRGADLLDPALVEDRDAVAHREGLVLVVRDVDERDPDLALDPLQLDLHPLAELQVERAERLVQQQHLRAVDERARERDSLALSARELRGPACAVAGQLHGAKRFLDALLALGLRHAADLQSVRDVLGNRHVRKERVVLEDGVHVPRVRRVVGHVAAGELHRARVGLLEAGDQAERRRLAGAGRPEHREELAPGDLEVDAVDGDDVAVELPQSLESNVRVGRRLRGVGRLLRSLSRQRRQAPPP